MKFDDILSEINGFGKFQIMLVLMQMLSRITLPCHFLLNNFMAAVPDHHCNLTSLDDGDAVFRSLTAEQKVAAGIPTEKHGSPSSCRMYVQPRYQNYSGNSSSEDEGSVHCQNGWVYDNSTFKSTLATEVRFTLFHFCLKRGRYAFLILTFLIFIFILIYSIYRF